MHRVTAAVLVLIALPHIAGEDVHAETERVTRYARFKADGTISYGLVEGDRIRRLRGDLFGGWERTDTTYPLGEVELLVPSEPKNVYAVGLNYRSHLGNQETPAEPLIFFKPLSSLTAHGNNIVLPAGSRRVDFEAEMVLVVGRKARNVPEAEARDYLLGVTCGNDVSARDWQQKDSQWWRAKGADTFGPVGPFIASGLDYDDLQLELRLNGEVKQKQRTSDLLFNTAQIVSWISRHATLEPGDLIYTGTPGSTSPLKAGDVVEVELEGVGVLRNVVQGEP